MKLASEGIKEDGELRHYLGKAYYENDKYDEAITELLASISYYKANQTKEKADAYNDLGLAYKRKMLLRNPSPLLRKALTSIPQWLIHTIIWDFSIMKKICRMNALLH